MLLVIERAFRVLSWLLSAVTLLLLLSEGWAFDDRDTHRRVTRLSAGASDLDNLLKGELQILEGVRTLLQPAVGQRRAILTLLEDGSEFEDNPTCRARNHFHNPLRPFGSSGVTDLPSFVQAACSLTEFDQTFSSVLWGTRFTSPQERGPGAGNPFDWDAARIAYRDALILRTPAEREAALARTFETLGHVKHLVQDLAVPAHVRNDFQSHLQYFNPLAGFGRWTENGFERFVRRNPQLVDEAAARAGEHSIDFISQLVTRFWDMDFDTTPSTGTDQGLAEYTNANFASQYTILTESFPPSDPKFFPYPRKDETNLQAVVAQTLSPRAFIAEDQKIDVGLYISKSGSGETIEHFARLGYLWSDVPPDRLRLSLQLDDIVNADYATLLLPRAIAYSRGLLDYFFRGKLDVDLVPADLDDASVVRLSGTNASAEALGGGTLTLYADNPTTGLRSAATGLDQALTVTADPGASVESARFQVPENSERFVAVYKGTLGLEKPEGTFPGGVIAKVVGGVRVEEVFSDGINWKLRTPKGVFLLKQEGNLPLTAAEFEGVRWGDGDNLLVARTPFGMDQPNRFVVYEIQRQAGSAEVVTVSTPDGPAVPLTVRNEALFPGGGIDLDTTVTFVSSIQYSQRIAEYVHKAVGTTDPQGNCAIDHRELGPISVRTVTSGGPTFSGGFQVRLDLAREGTFGTLSEPYIWFLQEVAATADARLLGLVVVFLTSPEGSPVSVPFIGLNRDTGAEEIVGQQTFSPSFPPGVNILVWALVDLRAGTMVASTATSNISLASQTGGEGFPDVYQHFVNTCTGFEQWARVSPVPVSSDFPIDQLTNVSVGGGILAHTVLGWVKDELNTLTFNGQRLFDFQLGTVFGSGRSLIECVGLPAGGVTCNGIEQSGSQGVLVKMADNLQDARRSRPAPGSERLALIASTGFGARDTVLAWDPGKGARVLLALPGLGENVHVLGPVTGTATLVAPLDGWRGSFHIVSLEGSESPAFFSNDSFNFFTLLNPRFLYNSDDLKFYRRRPPLQASVLPLKLADLPDGSNPVGDYHAIRLP